MIIVICLKDFGLLLKAFTKTIGNGTREQCGGLLTCH